MRFATLMCLCLCSTSGEMRAEELQAGAAVIDITPPTGFPMWGYAARRDAPCVGVRDRLKARALVLAVGKEKLALVSLDLGRAPTRRSTAAIRKLVDRAGVGTIFLVGSHTHHGPVLELDSWPTPKTSYVRSLEKKIAAVILAADRARVPARLGVASKQLSLNRNRHSKRKEKPVDRELLVLRVEDRKGKVLAHAVNFAAHPTMLPARLREFSADYVGVLAREVERVTAAPCLFLQGAAGDLSPNPSKGWNPDTFGKELAGEVLALARTIEATRGEKATLKSHEEDFRFRCRLPLDNPIIALLLGQAFFPELIAFYEREYREGVRPHLSIALLDGQIGFVGVSGEFFSGHALALKRRARLEHLFFLGYCNDYQQYFPTIEAASEGGYGTEPHIAPAEIGAGEQIMNHALIALYRLRGKLPPEPAASATEPPSRKR
jgi:neutral ceramidase